jgi:4a-hydroxytetrahydrobiopterin dehydratase
VTTRDVAAAASLSELAIRMGATAQPDKYPA